MNKTILHALDLRCGTWQFIRKIDVSQSMVPVRIVELSNSDESCVWDYVA